MGTIAEANALLIRERKTLEKYVARCGRLIEEKNFSEEVIKAYIGSTGDIRSIFHNMKDHSLDELYNSIMAGQMNGADDYRSVICKFMDKSNSYIDEYKSMLRRDIICGQEVYYFPLPDYYEQQRLRYGGRKTISETCNRQQYLCPVCGSADRDRLIVAYLKKVTY